jgi:hypothetical protein
LPLPARLSFSPKNSIHWYLLFLEDLQHLLVQLLRPDLLRPLLLVALLDLLIQLHLEHPSPLLGRLGPLHQLLPEDLPDRSTQLHLEVLWPPLVQLLLLDQPDLQRPVVQ